MKKHLTNKKIFGFSFVELIVVISIIAIIAIIGIGVNNNYTEKSKNTKITQDLETINSALDSYKTDTSSLPSPAGNLKYYDNSSDYVHYDDPLAFGVYGNITQNTIPKKYLDSTPIDPRTNQFYAYGKTLTGGLYYEISGVNKTNGNFESKVVGNYSGDQVGPYNLIREYNGPDFVYDNSKNNFPYNPEENILKGKIGYFSGSVEVNGNLIDSTRMENNDLITGDIITVATGSKAVIYYSDGTKSELGDTNEASKLILAKMTYVDENNLLTKVQLILDFGTIWNRTSKLASGSEFEIYTTNTELAVRGTIFGVTKADENEDTKTDVSIITGSVSISKISPVDIKTLNENIIKNSINYISDAIETIESTGIPRTYSSTVGGSTMSETSGTTPDLIDDDGLSNIKPILKSVSSGEVQLEFPSTFSGADKVIISNNKDITNSGIFDSNILTIRGLTGSNDIKVCDANQEKCTISITVSADTSYNENSSTCDSYEVYFENLGCVSVDKDSYNSGYTLVAYAPYDTNGDLNMYKSDGTTITFSSGGAITFDDSNPDNKGIKIMTGTSDWLDYNGSELGIGSDYAIEMSVRGSALNRTSAKYYLFSSDNDNMGIYIKNTGQIVFYDGTIPNTFPSINSVSSLFLNSNLYYPVILKVNGGNYSITINGIEMLSGLTNLQLKGNVYIGSSNIPNLQWNDIINYVKLYTK